MKVVVDIEINKVGIWKGWIIYCVLDMLLGFGDEFGIMKYLIRLYFEFRDFLSVI